VFEVDHKWIKMWAYLYTLLYSTVALISSFNFKSVVNLLLRLILQWLIICHSVNLVIRRSNLGDKEFPLRGAQGKKIVLGMPWYAVSSIIKSIIN
jgi:hypothetical protein